MKIDIIARDGIAGSAAWHKQDIAVAPIAANVRADHAVGAPTVTQNGRARAVAWLCGIARNCARQRLERDRTFLALEDDTQAAGHQGLALNPEPVADLTRAEGIERVRKAVLGLPVHYREAIVLCDLEELSYAEAAEAMGCAVGTVRSRVHRGRELLARKLISVPGTAPTKVARGRCFA